MTIDYPELYQSSDKASGRAQRYHLWLLGIQLGALFLTALSAGSVALAPEEIKAGFYVLNAILLAVALLSNLLTKAQRFDKTWFDCRAIAESVKTATWRYMMQARPYPPESIARELDKQFIAELNEIRSARPDAALATLPGTYSIPNRMQEVRAGSLDERKRLYVNERLANQKLWYARKANSNKSAATRWFWTVVSIQTGALTIAIIQASTGPFSFNAVSLLMTVAASLLAWSQAKRFEELGVSYSLASQELSSLEALAQHVRTAETFSEFVDQTEETISREHTMWCAKRNVRLR